MEKVFNIPQILNLGQKCIKTMENLTVLAVARGGGIGGGGGGERGWLTLPQLF